MLTDTILIVDDEPNVLNSLERILRGERYRVLKASSGKEALELLHQEDIALIICDQRMPEMEGIEVLAEAFRVRPDVGRVILSGESDMNMVIEAINVGRISQFIHKPWDEATLKQTVKNSVSSFKLKKENERLQSKIMEQHKELASRHESLKKELDFGAKIHELLLMGKSPQGVPEAIIEAISIPSKEIDGDFYDFYRPESGVIDLVLGDVMGKGIPAALVGTAVKSQLMRYGEPINGGVKNSLNTILSGVSNSVYSQLEQLGFFVSLFYGRFDFSENKFEFIDCGSTKPLHYSVKNHAISTLEGDNFPLGVKKEREYRVHSIHFEAGDFFIFYSDGATEMMNPMQELYGLDRFKKLILSNAHLPPRAMLHLIQQSVLNFGKKTTYDDDLTLLIVKILKGRERCSSSFAVSMDSLEGVRKFVEILCSNAKISSEEWIYSLQLAVNEAFSNIVQHGFKKNPVKDIVIKGEIHEKGILLVIEDQGDSFDPERAAEPSFAGDRTNGFGLFMIKQCTDEFSYSAKNNECEWNRMTLFKRYSTSA